MINYLKTFLDILKLRPSYLITIDIVSGFLLFSSDNLLKRFGVFKLTNNDREWIGCIFIICAAMLLVWTLKSLINRIKSIFILRSIAKCITKKLNSLTEEEKQILRFYIIKQTKTNMLRVHDGVVQGLESNRIIYMATTVGNLVEGVAYNITEYAWQYLNENQSLLTGTTDTYRPDKRFRY